MNDVADEYFCVSYTFTGPLSCKNGGRPHENYVHMFTYLTLIMILSVYFVVIPSVFPRTCQ